MAIICPTILATEPHGFRAQLERIEPFAKRIQIDFGDGELEPTKTVAPIQTYWPTGVKADMHMMYKHPQEEIDNLIALQPSLVIVHAEAEVDHLEFFKTLAGAGIKTGLALLPATTPSAVSELINVVDHALIFGGSFGSMGGTADLSQLAKVASLRAIKQDLEIGWDGGINDQNATEITMAGVDVLNVGSFIHQHPSPDRAYAILEALVQGAISGGEKADKT